MNYGTPYSNQGLFVAQASPLARIAFIRQVYSLLCGSLFVTVLSGFICTQESVLPIISGLTPLLWIGEIVCIIILSFSRRVTGLNLLIFALFAALTGAGLGPLLLMLSIKSPGLPMAAATLTLGVFGGLSLYALTSRKDFSYLGGMLFAGVIGLIIVGLLLMFFNVPFLSSLYSLAGVLIFSGFVLYDTSQIMHRLQPNEAIIGAIELYLDFLNLFLFILRLLSNRDD